MMKTGSLSGTDDISFLKADQKRVGDGRLRGIRCRILRQRASGGFVTVVENRLRTGHADAGALTTVCIDRVPCYRRRSRPTQIAAPRRRRFVAAASASIGDGATQTDIPLALFSFTGFSVNDRLEKATEGASAQLNAEVAQRNWSVNYRSKMDKAVIGYFPEQRKRFWWGGQQWWREERA